MPYITLQWIKGHSRSRANDEADGLARSGSEMDPAAPEPIIPIPFSQVRSWISNTTAILGKYMGLQAVQGSIPGSKPEILPETNLT